MSYWLNRTACNVLDEMREANKTRNYSYLEGLVEELQSMCNRMEAALGDMRQLDNMPEEISKLKKEIKALRAEKKELGGKDEEY